MWILICSFSPGFSTILQHDWLSDGLLHLSDRSIASDRREIIDKFDWDKKRQKRSIAAMSRRLLERQKKKLGKSEKKESHRPRTCCHKIKKSPMCNCWARLANSSSGRADKSKWDCIKLFLSVRRGWRKQIFINLQKFFSSGISSTDSFGLKYKRREKTFGGG